ncbi:SMP-30/gluconolactonase/LRE family protein [Devosia sp. FJ2-5-3]|uniref:SMP-30/gluconolactonase/LRE family protein n=1 Tax=Devosia sp. FJ2-5-3 TaxID=2976680 RepID=UPI0023D812D8|nr:SMP-30/gluconolactonase/LRE family protein [Devosia sp. FJ2-5-3]WEJ57094.1 SMP-30/gluconolactonase/LRE family protein [Devosia sp. FJ2-5-3]
MVEGIYEIIDERFRTLFNSSAALDLIHTGCRWAEGPVWFKDGNYLLWSDIPNNRMLRYIPEGGVSVYRADARYSNGNTRDRQGRLVTCEHGARRVTRTEVDGSITVLAYSFEGKRLNSPNDVVVHSNGSVWFSDPTYGIQSDYEGHKATPEQDTNNVYRIDPQTGVVEAVVRDFVQPNGLAFSPDETRLYVADSGSPRHIRVFDVVDGRALSSGRVFCTVDPGVPDGFRFDIEGNLWTSAADGVHCFAPDGTLLGKILTPERVANLTFGGPKGNRLYIAATSSIYAIYVTTNGAAVP